MLERLGGPRSARVLEIGVGGGDATEEIARRFQDVPCLDLSEETLDVTRRRLLEQGLPAPRCVVARAEDAIFAPGSFDKIIMLNILEHIGHPPVALKRMRPWLADNGTIHIIVNLATSLRRRLCLKMGAIANLSELSESDHRLGHYRVYTLEQLREHLASESFAVSYERPFYLKPLETAADLDVVGPAVGSTRSPAPSEYGLPSVRGLHLHGSRKGAFRLRLRRAPRQAR